MKIILMFTAFNLSGAPKSMAWVANQLSQAGHDVTLLSYFGKKCEQPLNSEVKFHSLNCSRSGNWLVRNTVGMLAAISQIDRFLTQEQPDLVITFLDSVSQVYLFVNRFRKRFRILCSERVDPYSYGKITAKRLAFLMGISDGVVFQTEGAQSFYKEKERIYSKSMVIPNPVIRTSQMEKALQTKCALRDGRIVTAGRLEIRQKRQDVLIRAFAIVHKTHPVVKLHIFGDGSDRKKLELLSKELGLEDSVVFEGQSSHILEDICNASLFVLSSDYEGMPNALIEAMMLGVPSVSTDCSPGGARLLINDGENGYLVPRGNHELLADRMIRLIENQEIADHFSKESVKITERFSEERITNMWCAFVRKICEDVTRES